MCSRKDLPDILLAVVSAHRGLTGEFGTDICGNEGREIEGDARRGGREEQDALSSLHSVLQPLQAVILFYVSLTMHLFLDAFSLLLGVRAVAKVAYEDGEAPSLRHGDGRSNSVSIAAAQSAVGSTVHGL